MGKRWIFLFVLGVLILPFLPVGTAVATTITFEATDLADAVVGEDLWLYDYWVSDNTFDAWSGFQIYFDLSLYSDLEDPAPFVNADWDPIVFQPEPAIPADGAYDALALVDGASLADPFTLSFVWLGSGTPGSQEFLVYDSFFDPIEFGTTAPVTAVPEPSTLLLLGVGLTGLAIMRRSRRADL